MLRAAAQGLDAVIVNPTFALGPSAGNTTSLSIELIRKFLQRRIPAYVDGGLNVVDVRDVATGHLLADVSGRKGERYILGGRNFTMQRLLADLSRISGVPVPTLRLPPQLAVEGARLSEQLHLGLGPVGRRDALGVALVDLLLGQGQAGARLRRPAARGDARGRPGDDHRAARRPGRRRPRSRPGRCSRSPGARRGW